MFSFIDKIEASSSMELIGLHAHIGSQIFDINPFLVEVEKLLDLYHMIYESKSIIFSEINIGGGVGIQYVETDDPPTIDAFVKEISNGLFYLGEESKKLGLIDTIGNKEKAVEYLEKELNITVKLTKYERKKTLTEILSQTVSEKFFYIGKGIASSILAKEEFSITT